VLPTGARFPATMEYNVVTVSDDGLNMMVVVVRSSAYGFKLLIRSQIIRFIWDKAPERPRAWRKPFESGPRFFL